MNEDLGVGDGLPDQKKSTRKRPVFPAMQVVEVKSGVGSWEVWEETDDLENSGPSGRHYLFDPATGDLRFGNGLNGRIPTVSDQVRISYRTTLVSGGNIPEGRPFMITASGFSGISVTNPAAATGGRDVESISSAKARARRDLATRYRAITADDFEAVVRATPGLRVARAKAIMNHHPLSPCVPNFPNWVTVVVLPVSRFSGSPPLPGEGFLDTVARHLRGGKKFAVHDGRACNSCRGYLHFVLHKLRRPDPTKPGSLQLDRPFEKKVNVFLGPDTGANPNPEETNIFMGICQQHHAEMGKHLPGCPPHAEVIMKGLFGLFPYVERAKYANESSEAKLERMLDEVLKEG